MSTRDSKEKRRQALGKGNPDAPETAGTVPTDSVARRLRVREPVTDLQPGETVEIDLFGDGTMGFYASLEACPSSGDKEKTLLAAELLDRCIQEVQESGEIGQSRHDTTYWFRLVCRLQAIMEALWGSRVSGISPPSLLVEIAQERLLHALRYDLAYDELIWGTVTATLNAARSQCWVLAEKVEEEIMRHHTERSPVNYVLLRDLSLANTATFVNGLAFAARLGIDINALELGCIREGDVVATLRGQKLLEPAQE